MVRAEGPSIKYVRLPSGERLKNDYHLIRQNTAEAGKTDEIITSVSFYSETEKQGDGFSGTAITRVARYLLALK